MRVVNLNCNECGAPLVVPMRTNYLTCEFCGTQLHVVRDGGAAYTEIQQLSERTDRLEDDVAQLKANDQLESLDRRWQQEMKQYEVKGKDGEASIPTKTGVLVGSGAAAAFGVLWTIFAAGITAGSPFGLAGLFPLFGVILVVAALASGFTAWGKAEAYERPRREYERERRELVGSIRDPSR